MKSFAFDCCLWPIHDSWSLKTKWILGVLTDYQHQRMWQLFPIFRLSCIWTSSLSYRGHRRVKKFEIFGTFVVGCNFATVTLQIDGLNGSITFDIKSHVIVPKITYGVWKCKWTGTFRQISLVVKGCYLLVFLLVLKKEKKINQYILMTFQVCCSLKT